MESPEYVSTKLKLTAGASDVHREVIDGERLEYRLVFDDDVGFTWLSSELSKAFTDLEVGLQKWEIEPAANSFVVSVRETERRSDLESDQESLQKWDQN